MERVEAPPSLEELWRNPRNYGGKLVVGCSSRVAAALALEGVAVDPPSDFSRVRVRYANGGAAFELRTEADYLRLRRLLDFLAGTSRLDPIPIDGLDVRVDGKKLIDGPWVGAHVALRLAGAGLDSDDIGRLATLPAIDDSNAFDFERLASMLEAGVRLPPNLPEGSIGEILAYPPPEAWPLAVEARSQTARDFAKFEWASGFQIWPPRFHSKLFAERTRFLDSRERDYAPHL